MKKYLLFTPLALNYYIWLGLMFAIYGISNVVPKPVDDYISSAVMFLWLGISLIAYIIGLVKMVKDESFDEYFAAKVSMFVKFPQILPGLILGLYSIGVMIAPMGIFMSIFLWLHMAIVYISSSVVLALACRRISKAGKLNGGSAIILGVLSFFPLLEYVVPVILMMKVGKRKYSVEA